MILALLAIGVFLFGCLGLLTLISMVRDDYPERIARLKSRLSEVLSEKEE